MLALLPRSAITGGPILPGAEVTRLRSERGSDQAALEQLASDHYAERLISRAEFLAARSALGGRIAEADRQIEHAALPLPEVHPEPAQAWAGMDVDGRRKMITACLDAVIIRPASLSGRHRFDPSRLSVVARSGEALDVRQITDGGPQLVARTGLRWCG